MEKKIKKNISTPKEIIDSNIFPIGKYQSPEKINDKNLSRGETIEYTRLISVAKASRKPQRLSHHQQ